MGAGLSLCFCQPARPWLQARREQHASKEQACPTCSSRLKGPQQAAAPSWSTGHPRAQGRQEGKGGWDSTVGPRHAGPQPRSVTHCTPAPVFGISSVWVLH